MCVLDPLKILKGLFSMYECFACMYVIYTTHLVPSDALELELQDPCEQQCGCWGSNLSPLEELPVLLAIEPSLQLVCSVLNCES